MRIMFYYLILISLLVFGCSGEDEISVDANPPAKVSLINHLGDTGDYLGGFPQNYHDTSGFESNGIDALTQGDWIQIQWEHPLDDDIDHVNIYRFSIEDYEDYLLNQEELGDNYQYATRIAQIDYVNVDHYYDTSDDIIDRVLFYFIGLTDEAGNETFSDTTGYHLINKALLLGPSEGDLINQNEITFSWQLDSSQLASNSRILLFNQQYDLIWAYTPLEFEDTTVEYSGEEFTEQYLIWRVDVFGNLNYYEIDGKTYSVDSGSESTEISFSIY